jgi:hypothetical protein
VIAGLVAFVALGTWWSTSSAQADDPRLFANRMWVERTPNDDRDLVLRIVAVDVAGRKAGLVNRSSKYAFAGEVFGWSLDGDPQKPVLVLNLPQQKAVARLQMRSWACGNEAPSGFDLCLELSDGRSKLRLYSQKGWKKPKAEDLPVPLETVSLGDEAGDRSVDLETLTTSL